MPTLPDAAGSAHLPLPPKAVGLLPTSHHCLHHRALRTAASQGHSRTVPCASRSPCSPRALPGPCLDTRHPRTRPRLLPWAPTLSLQLSEHILLQPNVDAKSFPVSSPGASQTTCPSALSGNQSDDSEGKSRPGRSTARADEGPGVGGACGAGGMLHTPFQGLVASLDGPMGVVWTAAGLEPGGRVWQAGEVEAVHRVRMAHESSGSLRGRLSPHPATSEPEGSRKQNPDASSLGRQASERRGAGPAPVGVTESAPGVSAGSTAAPSSGHCQPPDSRGSHGGVPHGPHPCRRGSAPRGAVLNLHGPRHQAP